MISENGDFLSPLGDADWNFDNVPKDELEVCCLWEYARESAFIRAIRARSSLVVRLQLRIADQMELNVGRREFNEMFAVLGRRSILFQEGFYDFGGEEHFPGFVSKFPEPWQNLTKFERSVLMQTAAWSAKKTMDLPGFRRLEQVETSVMTKLFKPRPYKEVFGEARLSLHEQYHSGHKLRAICPNFIAPGGQEDLMIRIEWGGFTNEQLVNEFAQWLKENEPPGVARPDGRGHKNTDSRASLTRLAVLRLLGHFTALQIVDPKQNKFPAVWETKQFSRPKWHDVTKWYDARREAGKRFQSLFPFLPKDDKPISWKRQARDK